MYQRTSPHHLTGHRCSVAFRIQGGLVEVWLTCLTWQHVPYMQTKRILLSEHRF